MSRLFPVRFQIDAGAGTNRKRLSSAGRRGRYFIHWAGWTRAGRFSARIPMPLNATLIQGAQEFVPQLSIVLKDAGEGLRHHPLVTASILAQ